MRFGVHPFARSTAVADAVDPQTQQLAVIKHLLNVAKTV